MDGRVSDDVSPFISLYFRSGREGDPVTRSMKACLAQLALVLPDNEKNAMKLKSLLAATVLLDGLCTVSHDDGSIEQTTGRAISVFLSPGGNLLGARFSAFLLDPRTSNEFSNQSGGISLLRSIRNDSASMDLFKNLELKDVPPSWEEDSTVPNMAKIDRILRALDDIEVSPSLKRHFLSMLLALNMLHEVVSSMESRAGKLDERRLKYACAILDIDPGCLMTSSVSMAIFKEQVRALSSSLWRSLVLWWCGYFNRKFAPKANFLRLTLISLPGHAFGCSVKNERMLFVHAAHEFLNSRAFDTLIVKREALFVEHKLKWDSSNRTYDRHCLENLLQPGDGLLFFLAEKASPRVDRRKLIESCRELALLSDEQSEICLDHQLGRTLYDVHHMLETYVEDVLDESVWNSLLKSKNPLVMAVSHFGEFLVDNIHNVAGGSAVKTSPTHLRQNHRITMFSAKEVSTSSSASSPHLEVFDIDLVNPPVLEAQTSSPINEWKRTLTGFLNEMQSIEDSSFRLFLHFRADGFSETVIATYGLDTLSRIHALGFPAIRDYSIMLQSFPELSAPLLKEKPSLKDSPKDACKIMLDRLGRSHGYKLTGTKIFMTCDFVEELRAICLEARVYDVNGTKKQIMDDSAIVDLQQVVLQMGTNTQALDPLACKKGDTGKTNTLLSSTKKSDTSADASLTRTRKFWLISTWIFTWWIPDCLLSCFGMKEQPMRVAWREKVALCSIIMMLSATLLFWITGFAGLICPTPKAHQWKGIERHSGEQSAWLGIHGKVIDVTEYLPYHYGGRKNILPFLGRDASVFFPLPSLQTMAQCVHNVSAGQRAEAKRGKVCAQEGFKYCHTSAASKRLLKKYTVGDVAYDTDQIRNNSKINQAWFTFHNKVYNVTQYLMGGDLYLRKEINRIIINHLGEDVTAPMMQFKDAALLESCFDTLFYAGRISEEYGTTCHATDIILLISVGGVVFIMAFKFLTALQLGSKRSPEHHDKFVLLTVPCYTEGEASLRKTIDSLSVMEYDDNRKLLFLIADGMVTGSGNDRPTPKIVLDILGANPAYDPPACEYQALGEGMKQLNYAKVYSGLYYCAGHRVPYLVITKVGKPSEQVKPGNRGKRDSQLILLKFLNKIQYDLPMNPLELQIYQQINDVIGVDPNLYEFMMTVDADTEVRPDSLNRMVSCMLHDTKIMALCGETEVANDKNSWVTMIQVYEYYMSHHISKAFESLFGSVTCLPGCFSLYRIKLPIQNMAPCLTLPDIIQDYSENEVNTLHMKNLLHLGEDRYLTTLMLKYFPQMKLAFTSDAQCRTVVPDTWNVLLSQRRRWINSTIHNFFELLKLKELCGFCLFSMRFVVLMDLLATLIMPAFVGYMFYLIYVSIRYAQVPLLSLIIFCSMYGLQAILFIIKKQWQHIGWMVIYILAIPIFHFTIPLYAFWHFDDFSWGRTRRVQGIGGEKDFKILDDEERQFDPSIIPLKKLSQIEQERWDQASESDDASVREEYPQLANDGRGMNGAVAEVDTSRELSSHDRMGLRGRESFFEASTRYSVMKLHSSNESIGLTREHDDDINLSHSSHYYHQAHASHYPHLGFHDSHPQRSMVELESHPSWSERGTGDFVSLTGHDSATIYDLPQQTSMYPLYPPVAQHRPSLDESSFYVTQRNSHHVPSHSLHDMTAGYDLHPNPMALSAAHGHRFPPTSPPSGMTAMYDRYYPINPAHPMMQPVLLHHPAASRPTYGEPLEGPQSSSSANAERRHRNGRSYRKSKLATPPTNSVHPAAAHVPSGRSSPAHHQSPRPNQEESSTHGESSGSSLSTPPDPTASP